MGVVGGEGARAQHWGRGWGGRGLGRVAVGGPKPGIGDWVRGVGAWVASGVGRLKLDVEGGGQGLGRVGAKGPKPGVGGGVGGPGPGSASGVGGAGFWGAPRLVDVRGGADLVGRRLWRGSRRS
ncbi:hypothetical protein TIFTF001_002659 [Ficus carica]|uniref:Uncharacterized protein n=1 Tax=Ficus carica TaxID=3494 RepID=A0AA87Z4M9_FICCA|nr:hypothetical protein TIFTF001_002659 [Ficus carica]